MDIEHLGDALIEQLVDADLVRNIADIYRLRRQDLINFEGMGEKSTDNIIKAIDESKTRPEYRLVTALGIPLVGGQSAQILAEHFGSLEALMSAEQEELAAIDQIGPIMAKSVHEYFKDEKNLEIVTQILTAGVSPQRPKAQRLGKLEGRTFVVTGTLENFSRQQAQQAIRQAGAKSSGSVSKKTDFVLAGKNPGSKLDKARKLGAEVINEEQFVKMIED